MKRILMLVAVCAAVTSVFAATKTTWTDNSGDHRWSNSANWTAGVPDCIEGQTASVPTGDWTIIIDEPSLYYALDIADGSGTVTLKGSGSLSFILSVGSSAKKLSIGAGRELVVDGPEITEWSYEQLGTVTVKGGIMHCPGKGMTIDNGQQLVVDGGRFEKFSDTSGLVTVTNGAAVVVKGGYAEFNTLRVRDGGVLRVQDGVVRMPEFDSLSIAAGATFDWWGGTVELVDELDSDARIQKYFPRKNTGLNVLSDNGAAVKLVVPSDYDFSGALSVTGGALSVTMTLASHDMKITGRGSLVANQIRHYAGKSNATVTFDLESLTLGAGGFESTDKSHNDYFHFVNGITFGAFGNWGSTDASAEKPTRFVLYGPVAFDTLDAFDGTTKRSIALPRVNMSAVNSLAVRGGGRVDLAVTAVPPYLHELSLTDATTLALQGSNLGLRAGSVTTDEGSVLSYAPDADGFVDAALSANLAAGSVKLEFADPAFTAARTPVYFAPAGTDADLEAFDTTDVPDGLSLAKRENVVYLTDGSPDANDTSSATASAIYWTGDVSGSWQDADNWTSKKAVTTDAFGEMRFKGWKNMVMTNSTSQARPSRITVDAGCGPVWVRGSAYFRFNNANAIFSYSDNPLIIEATVGAVNGNYFGVNNCGNSYVALTGGAYLEANKNANTNRIVAVGDVRLGGVWRFNRIELTADTDQKQPTRLTLLPGATLTTIQTSSSVSIVKSAGISVAAGANLTMNNAGVSFSNYENTHFVDGTWAVACPFKATSRQTFRGTGTLKLASLAAAAGGIEIADSLTLVPGDWDAATEVFFRETPTVKTEAATTIGEAVVFELEQHATLTVDTTGGDLTMETPILGGGDVVKTGVNALVLSCAGNVIDTLTVSGGTVKPGPALVAEADAGYVPFLTVRKLVGELTVKDAKIKAVENADGTTTYSFKNRHGMVLIAR